MKNYTFAAYDEIVNTLCMKVDALRADATATGEYYTGNGIEIPDYAKEDIERKGTIADLIEKYIEKNLNPRI